jgi:hypothetical protein
MKITIEKTPSVSASRETLDIERDLGIDLDTWQEMTSEEKDSAIWDFINSEDALAREAFHFSFKILND